MKKLVSVEEARELVLKLREKLYFNRGIETVPVQEALGRELANDILADENSPPHDLASFDGYALRSEDSKNYPLKIVHRIYAGDDINTIPELCCGEAMAIATGAFLPRGADAVLRLEDARVEGDLLYGVQISAGTKVVKVGSNYKKGELILRRGQRLRPQEVAILHGMGIKSVEVFKRPRVAVFSTGDEICRGLLRDTNAPLAMAFLREWDCEASYLGAVPDDFEATKKKFEEACSYDAIVTSGGVSVGEKDYVLRAMQELGEVLLHKVKIRPGKPIAVGIINGKPVFALPGKSTGSFVALELVVRNYFIDSASRATVTSEISEEIRLSTKDTDAPDTANVVFVHLQNSHAVPIGYEASPMKLIKRGELYNVSTIASSLRAALADGYVVTSKDIKKGEVVEINLLK